MKMRRLYLVAAERTISGGLVTFANVGETNREDVEVRFRDHDYARKKGGGNWKLLATWELPGGMRDHDVHKKLTSLFGLYADPEETGNSEEYRFDNSIQAVKDMVSQALSAAKGDAPKAHSFKMRPEQQECCDKAVEAFKTSDRFLMDCKMRFGKTFTAHHIAKRLEAKNVLILTYKPAVKSGWAGDLETHVDFDGIKFYSVEDGYSGDGVYFSSMQGIMSDDRSSSERREWIFSDCNWDLIIFDEEHYGTRREKAQDIFSRLKAISSEAKWLMLSGTPFQARLLNEYHDDNIYRWSYVDEQEAKREWDKENPYEENPYEYLPAMEFHTFDFASEVQDLNSEIYTEDEQFHINKLFAVKGGKFIYERQVNDFLGIMAGDTGAGTSTEAKRGKLSPFNIEGTAAEPAILNHQLWMLTRVDSCRALKKKLESHSYWKQYEVINVSGNETTDLKKVKKKIATEDKTITLSVGRFTTGVTIPEWGSVWFLSDGKSPTAYFQTAFRCQSPWQRKNVYGKVEWYKKTAYVFDFNPTRTLEMIWQQQISTSKDTSDVEPEIAEWLENAPLYRHGKLGLKQLGTEAVVSMAFSGNNFVEKFASGYAIAVDNACEEVIEKISGVDASSAIAFRKEITNNAKKGKQKEKVKSSQDKQREKEVKKKIELLKERAQTVLKRLPSYLYVSDYNEESCSDIIKHAEPKIFLEETGVSIEIFKKMVDTGFVNKVHIDYCVKDFCRRENEIVQIFQG